MAIVGFTRIQLKLTDILRSKGERNLLRTNEELSPRLKCDAMPLINPYTIKYGDKYDWRQYIGPVSMYLFDRFMFSSWVLPTDAVIE